MCESAPERSRRRRLIAAAGATAVVVVGVAAFVALQGRGPAPRDETRGMSSPDSASDAAALAACREMEAMRIAVQRNQSAGKVFDHLDTAAQQARRAVADDVQWVPLQSGVDTVRAALEEDDPRAASLGMAIVRAHCERTTAPIGS